MFNNKKEKQNERCKRYLRFENVRETRKLNGFQWIFQSSSKNIVIISHVLEVLVLITCNYAPESCQKRKFKFKQILNNFEKQKKNFNINDFSLNN